MLGPVGPTVPDGGAHSRKRILVVDDDPDIRRLLQAALRSLAQVETAQNGSEALARFNHPPVPDLVLCDIMMPQLSGLDFVRRLRMIPGVRDIPVMFVTAKDTPQNVILGLQLGARHFVSKPFQIDELIKKVQKLLRG